MRKHDKSEQERSVQRPRYISRQQPANDGSGLVMLSLAQVLEAVDGAVRSAVSESQPRLLDREGLAERLSCSVSSVDWMRRRGCPCRYIGDSPRFVYEEVVQWMSSGKESA